MIDYLKFELSNVWDNAVGTVVNEFHSLIGDSNTVDRVFASYCEDKADMATRYMLTEPTVFPTFQSGVDEWADRAIRDVQRSTHNKWVRERIINLIGKEAGWE